LQENTMIRSMTAFAAVGGSSEQAGLSWEIKSVNHRYLEITPRLPEPFRELENAVRERCRDRLSRGRVEVTLRDHDDRGWQLNEDRLREVVQLSEDAAARLARPGPVPPLEVLRFPGVMEPAAQNEPGRNDRALALLDEALASLIATREREGEALRRVLSSHLAAARVQTDRVRAALPDILEHLRARLFQRVHEFAGQAHSERLEQELALTAQKMDVTEELDRLETHADEIQRVLDEGGTVGRRLDFLMQELNREANTLASKSVAGATSQAAVELKVLIEQMREQVQNVE
jgi:uncharacterized protein (TIGR00255 family)